MLAIKAPISNVPVIQYEDYIDARVLAAGVAETFDVPDAAGVVLFSAENDFWVTYISEAQENLVENGTFASDTEWTKGTGWSIAAGVATGSTASTALTQALDKTGAVIEAGRAYNITYTVSSRSAGSVQVSLGGTNGTSRSANGTYSETIVAGSSNTNISFTGTGFSGNIDNVIVTPIAIVPSGDITGGVAPVLNPTARFIAGTPKITQLSIISETALKLSLSYYKQH